MRRSRLLYSVFEILLLAIPSLSPIPATAQAKSAATIRGNLTDPSGAAVVGAAILAEPVGSANGAAVRAVSRADGSFALTLDPGTYGLIIEHRAFARVEREFTLSPGEARTWDVRLELERLSSSVVVTASAQAETTEDVPVPVDIITKQDIEERHEIFLLPMLQSAEGVSIARLGPFGGIGSLFLDGGNSYYTKVFIDGAPINVPGGALDFSNLTLDNVEKIEIVHGASSALFGSDAMTGVIQIFTHRGDTKTPVIEVEGDGGMFETGRGSARISGVEGLFDYSAGVAYFDTNGQGPGDYFRDTLLSGNFGWTFSDTDTLRLALRNTSSDAGQPGQTLLASVPFAVNFGQHTDLHDFSTNLTWELQPSEHWDNQLLGSESRFKVSEGSPAFVTPTSKFNRADLEDRLSYRFPGGGVTAGYVFEVENGPVDHRHNQAGYLETRYKVGRRWNLVAGARAEANSFFGTRVVPRVGASYALRFGNDFWGATRLRASYGKGIVEPEMFPADCTPILKPEQSTTADAGIDQYFASDRVRFSVTYFHNDFRNIVSFEAVNDPAKQNCPAFFGSFINTDKARAYGSNASFEAKVARWLKFMGNYTYDDSRVVSSPNATDPALFPGSRLLKRPLHSANLVANANFRRMNWNLAGIYVGRTADSDFLSTFMNGVCTGPCIKTNPSWVRWDLANSINLGHGVSTIARVENLLNRHYESSVGYPGLRLNYRLAVKYVWGRD